MYKPFTVHNQAKTTIRVPGIVARSSYGVTEQAREIIEGLIDTVNVGPIVLAIVRPELNQRRNNFSYCRLSVLLSLRITTL